LHFRKLLLTDLYIERIPGKLDGPVLVFLHHGLGAVSLWRDFPRQLSEATGLPAMVYDRRGHGRSPHAGGPPALDRHHQEAQVLKDLLEKHQITDFVLIGHSDGGTIALLYATLRGAVPPRGIITEAAHLFVEDVTRAGIRITVDQFSSNLRSRLMRHHGDKTDTLFWNWAGAWLSPQFDSWDISSELSRVRCPVWALQGADDEYGTHAQLQAISAGVAGPVETRIIPACAHDPHQQAPAQTLALMQQAIRSFGIG
jgi:pimeloyl-ACP methyl ester carboxylesterase